MEHIKTFLNKIRTWWKQFVKDHIIDELDPNDPDF